MKTETRSVTEFKAHCTEELRRVEEEGIEIEITRHGKVVALVRRPARNGSRCLGELLGTGPGAEFAPEFDPDQPACEAEAWEAERE